MTQKNWREVKEEIEQEIDRVWWEEPEEVKMSRLGVYPSGAGTDNQILGNLFFLAADTRAMGFWTAVPTIQRVIDDPAFSLDHCKSLWKYMNLHMATFLGGGSPNRPDPYLNLKKLNDFCQDIVGSYDSIKSKEELKSLLWSWGNYVNALHKWFFLIFPWEIGKLMPRIGQEEVEELVELSQVKITEGRLL